MKPTKIDSSPINVISRTKPRNVQDTLPWHRKALSTEASFVSPDSRNLFQKLGTLSRGQAIGFGVVGLGALDFFYNLFFKQGEGSFFRKYVFPLVTAAVGAIGIKTSRPPENAFLANLVRSSVTDFIKHFQKFLGERSFPEAVKDLYAAAPGEQKINLIKAVNFTLCSAWPALQRSLPDEYTDSPFINELRSIEPEEATVNRLQHLISEYGEEAVYNFINTKLFSEILEELSTQNSFRENLSDLIENINQIIEPSGAALDVSYDGKRRLINLCVKSTSSYGRPNEKELYNPIIVTKVRPEFILAAIKFIQQIINGAVAGQTSLDPNQQSPNDNKTRNTVHLERVTNNLTAYLGMQSAIFLAFMDSTGRARAGFFKVDPTTGERLSDKPDLIDLSLEGLFGEGYMPHPMTLMNMWKQGQAGGKVSSDHDFEFNGGRSKQTRHKETPPPGSSIASTANPNLRTGAQNEDNFEGPLTIKISQGYTPPDPKNIAEIPFPNEGESKLPMYLEFLGFDFHKDDNKEVKRLKVVLTSILARMHAGFKISDKDDGETNYYIGVMQEIGSRLKAKVISKDIGDVGINQKGIKFEIPQDLLKLDYFLEAFGIDDENITKDDIDKLSQAFYLIHDEQVQLLISELEEKADVKFASN